MTAPILPEPHRTEDVLSADGAIIRVRQHGNLDGPRLMMSHGNGLAIDGYYPFWRLFLEQYEVVLHDLRNHGSNPFCGGENHSYDGFVNDYQALREAVPRLFGAKPTAGLYHSASGLTALHDVHANGWHWDALVLYDPPISPAPGHPLRGSAEKEGAMIANWAARRRQTFDDPADLVSVYKAAKNFSRCPPVALELIARSVLRRTEGNGWELACPKDLECRIFESNLHAGLWDKLASIAEHSDRLLVLAADPGASVTDFPTNVLRHISATFGIEVRTIPEAGHMMQLEQPELIARETGEFLKHLGLV